VGGGGWGSSREGGWSPGKDKTQAVCGPRCPHCPVALLHGRELCGSTSQPSEIPGPGCSHSLLCAPSTLLPPPPSVCCLFPTAIGALG
jgi:hypothetical protein